MQENLYKRPTLFNSSSIILNFDTLYDTDGIMIISVIVYMLTNYLGMPLIYLTADCIFYDSEGVYVNVKLGIL